MPTEYTALVNSTMGRYLDFNECNTTGESVCHPSDHIPALVSVAEEEDTSGAELLEAIVLAYEIQGRGFDTGTIWNRGFDYVTWGAHAVAVAAGELIGLSQQELTDALGIAVMSNNGLIISRRDAVSNWKAIVQPYATHNVIQACQMARDGPTGPGHAFEGDRGFFEAVSGGEVLFDDLGGCSGRFRILGTSFKTFACGYFSHPSLTVLDIITEHNLEAKDLEEIDIHTFDHAIQIYASCPEKW
ncbi:MmgE/PrpD family protein [Salinigranum rubrum]|uniref:MmgE/PrpD family protein n=1 Tax=Salinigranum rubrum TaxID=755307 RepID=UPI001FE26272